MNLPFFNTLNKATGSYFDRTFDFPPAINRLIYEIINGFLILPKAKNKTLILMSIQPGRRLYIENPSYSIVDFYQKRDGTDDVVNYYKDPNDAKSLVKTGIHLDKFGFLDGVATGGFYGWIPFFGFPFFIKSGTLEVDFNGFLNLTMIFTGLPIPEGPTF